MHRFVQHCNCDYAIPSRHTQGICWDELQFPHRIPRRKVGTGRLPDIRQTFIINLTELNALEPNLDVCD